MTPLKQVSSEQIREIEGHSTIPVILDRAFDGKFFAFVPDSCQLMTLADEEVPEQFRHEHHAITNLGSVPSVEEEFRTYIGEKDIRSLRRQHPRGVALILTQECNLTCGYCLAKQGTFGLAVNTMSIETAKREIESALRDSESISFIKFFGGEPTLRFDLIEAISKFVKDELKIDTLLALTTNGTRDAERHIDLYKEYRVNVSVSVDGPRHIHDATRINHAGRGSFEKAIKYIETLRLAGFPVAAVGVFDNRHVEAGLSYYETVKSLNILSPIVKVQFLENLGSAHDSSQIDELSALQAQSEVEDCVDRLLSNAMDQYIYPERPGWEYDNNIFRFLRAVMRGNATPYQHACTASNLSTVFPSGDVHACYTLTEYPDSKLGSVLSDPIARKSARALFQEHHSWDNIAARGGTVPWYRGIVGDVCVADMKNTNTKALSSSPFYKSFQETAVRRVLKHFVTAATSTSKMAKLIHAVQMHETLSGNLVARGKSADLSADLGEHLLATA